MTGGMPSSDSIVGGSSRRSVRPDRGEETCWLPGDEFILKPLTMITHGVTIKGSPRDVWPWLAQMGAGSRAGWYSYDFLDNGRRRSAERVIPELQGIAIGSVFPAMPGVTEGFLVLAFEPYQYLVLGWPGPHDTPIVSWAFVLESRRGGATRLIVRVRAGERYRFHRLPSWLSQRIIRVVHFIMQRKQLLEIAKRVEQSAREWRAPFA